MRYATTNSGISAESAAWKPLGWDPVWYSEIEPFPSAVLAHHYPEAPNLGDMTKLFDNETFKGSIGTIDLISGGTPCQAFSQAGKGEGLDDPRGLLTLHYAEIAHRLRSRWLVWENVPKVLGIDEGRTFGLFLSALAGVWIEVPESGWGKSGVVEAPETGYGLAWSTLDAQYFGLAQRRKRIFLIGYLGDWRRAAAVLFDTESLSGNPAPSREKGQRTAGTISGRTKGGGGLGTDFECDGGIIAPTLQANGKAAGSATQQDAENGALVISASEGGNNQKVDISTTINAHRSRFDFESETFLIKGAAIGRKPEAGPQYGEILEDGSCYTLNTVDQHAVCFESRFARNGRGAPSELVPPLKAECGKTGKGDGAPLVYFIMPQNSGKDYKAREVEVSQPLMAGGPVGGNQGGDYVKMEMTVRRLTPVECERLQGFPCNYTDIPAWKTNKPEKYGGHGTPDGPRYRAIGNSMPVPVMRWIGERIMEVDKIENNG